MIHKHHIVPKHMGGSDDPSNIALLTIAEHADAHNLLWCLHKNQYDKIAERMLLGQITGAEATRLAQVESGKRNCRAGWNKGIPHTEVTKQKMRKPKGPSEKGKLAKLGSNNPRAKQITVNGITYPTVKAATEELNISHDKLRRVS